MQFLDDIAQRVGQLSDRDFYRYFGAGLVILILAAGGLIYWHNQTDYALRARLRNINESRNDVREVLERLARVEAQRKQVNSVLEEDPEFKLGGFMAGILDKLGLTDKVVRQDYATIEREEGSYNEVIVNLQIAGITMKQLTELLQFIERHERLLSKELDIVKSKKTPGTIDVTLIIGSLELKTAL